MSTVVPRRFHRRLVSAHHDKNKLATTHPSASSGQALKQFHIWYIGDGWSTPSGVHNCRQFLARALAPEVMFPSPQRLKPSHFRILTAPLKRCSTLYAKCENVLDQNIWRATFVIWYSLQPPAISALHFRRKNSRDVALSCHRGIDRKSTRLNSVH